jgi:hypothetical protein
MKSFLFKKRVQRTSDSPSTLIRKRPGRKNKETNTHFPIQKYSNSLSQNFVFQRGFCVKKKELLENLLI